MDKTRQEVELKRFFDAYLVWEAHFSPDVVERAFQVFKGQCDWRKEWLGNTKHRAAHKAFWFAQGAMWKSMQSANPITNE